MVQPVVVPPNPESPNSPLSPDSPDSANSPASPGSPSDPDRLRDRGEGLAEAEAAGIPVVDATQVSTDPIDTDQPPRQDNPQLDDDARAQSQAAQEQ